MRNRLFFRFFVMGAGVAFLTSGCMNAGERALPSATENASGRGSGPAALCAASASHCAGFPTPKGVASLFPENDPKDDSDPVRSTRDDMARCYQHYSGGEGVAPQWAELQRCEVEAFVRWYKGSNLGPDCFDRALSQSDRLIAAAQNGTITSEEAFLRWQMVMEDAALGDPSPARARHDLDKDALQIRQNNQCNKVYSSHEAPSPSMRALCRDRAYLAWARRKNQANEHNHRRVYDQGETEVFWYTPSDLEPMFNANSALAHEEEQHHRSLDPREVETTLALAQNQVDQRLQQRFEEMKEQQKKAEQEAEYMSTPAYQAQQRDQSLKECDKVTDVGERVQCDNQAWGIWGAQMGLSSEAIGDLTHSSDRIAYQHARGQLSASQATTAMSFALKRVLVRDQSVKRAAQAAQQRNTDEMVSRYQKRMSITQSVADQVRRTRPYSSGLTCQKSGSGYVQCTPN